MEAIGNGARSIALVGPAGAGKTSLVEALLHMAGAISRAGSVDQGNTVGDASPEARSRGASTELNLASFSWGGDDYVLLDCPGAGGFVAETDCALEIADLALVVITPDAERVVLAEPILRELEARDVPHIVFVNKIDKAHEPMDGLAEALTQLSVAPVIDRQMPISECERAVGYIDLALDRAFKFRPGEASEPVLLPEHLRERERAARFHMLEQLADHDDTLLEQLLNDEEPDLPTVCDDLRRETAEGLIVPVMLGSAINGFGIRRLLKALRHDTPPPSRTAQRLGIAGPALEVFKIVNDTSVGRLALGRVFGTFLAEGAELKTFDGQIHRAGALFAVQGSVTTRLKQATAGDVIGIAKTDGIQAGQRLGIGAIPPTRVSPAPRKAKSALAIAVKDHKDEVRLSPALNKLVEEDRGLTWETDEATRETLLKGMNDEHLALALARLKRRYGLDVTARPPSVAVRESTRNTVTQRGRHKKQSGGHGQYGDVVIEVRPLPRGSGFEFADKITGGVIPRQYIPAVEAGIKDAMRKGPLGCPVVDVMVSLVDGSYHSVDSSELAFRTAGRIAMSEALAAARPYLLEPIAHVTVHCPGTATSRLTSALPGLRARMLGMAPREGWSRWDTLEAEVPEAELPSFQADLRSLSQGMATFEARFDHLAEVSGKAAEAIAQRAPEPA